MDEKRDTRRSLGEEIEVAGHQLVDKIRSLIAEGNVRSLRVRAESGQIFLEIPLTAGAAAGGLVVLTAPWLAAIGALAGLATKLRLEIVRNDEADRAPGQAEPPSETSPPGEPPSGRS